MLKQSARLAALVFLFPLAAIFAQGLATISGVATDAQGAVISGANVTAVDAATGVRTAVKTNDSGFYSIPNLPVGSYTVTVEHRRLPPLRARERQSLDRRSPRPRHPSGTRRRQRDPQHHSRDPAGGIPHIRRRPVDRIEEYLRPALGRPAHHECHRTRRGGLQRLRYRPEAEFQPGRRAHAEPDVLDRRRHRPEHAHGHRPDGSRSAGGSRGGDQGAGEQLFGRIWRLGRRRDHRDHQVRHEPVSRQRSTNTCATTRWMRRDSSRPSRTAPK